MNAKSTLKMALDRLMVVLLPLLMAYSLIGEELHEWLGASMFLLFLGHHALNRRWYRSLAKGKWTARRLFRTFVNAALLLCMIFFPSRADGALPGHSTCCPLTGAFA